MPILVLVALLALAAPDDSRVLYGDGVVVHCPPSLEALGRQVRDRLPTRLDEVERALGVEMSGPVTVSIVADDDAFARIVGPRASQYAAVAYPRDATLVIKATAVRPEAGAPLPAIVRHELVHVVLGDRLRGRRLPTWFEEGLAELVGGAFPVASVEDLPAAVTAGRIRDLDDLARGFPEDERGFALAYRQSESFLRWIERRVGPRGIRQIVRRLQEGHEVDAALFSVTGEDRRELERLWRTDLEERNPLWLVLLRFHWFGFLLFASALLALAAFGRYLVRRRRILREFDEEDDSGEEDPGV